MGLDIPQLDDREFEEILEDARKRIPVHSDEWTDHNPSDPGITILEVLAWVAESNRYRLDRITESHVEQYLNLLDVSPERPQSATARLDLGLEDGVAGVVDAGDPVYVETVSDEALAFETTDRRYLTAASVGAVVTDHRTARTDNSNANETDGMYFLAFGDRAEDGATMYVGFRGDPFAGNGYLDLHVEFHDDELPAANPAPDGESVAFEPSVELAWEHCTDYDEWEHDANWSPVAVASDGTNRLYGSGTIRLAEPDGWLDEPGTILDRTTGYRWLRCRVTKGGYEVPPQLDALETNVAHARHRRTVTRETLRRADEGDPAAARLRGPPTVETDAGADGPDATTARPDQTFVFANRPVLDAEITVGGEPWEEVPSLDASGPDDEHYVLDSSAGTIRFGDEVQGKIPRPGQAVVAESYDHGGGTAGNVSPNATWVFEGEANEFVSVDAPAGAAGGVDEETVPEALTRLKRDLQTPERAVTPSDYADVATRTPGLRFGRAEAVVDAVDAGDCETAKLVRVVVVPHSTRPRPEPSDGFLRAVRRRLQRRRLLTDRVEVVPPEYVGVGVTAEIGVAPSHTEAGRIDAVADALDDFLDPLDGFDGGGWPFGRPVYVSELYEAIEAVDGVDTVFDVDVASSGDDGTDDDGNVLVGDTALVYPTDHDVLVRTDRGRCEGAD